MNPIVISAISWIAVLIILFPLLTSIIRVNAKENKGKFPSSLKIMQLHLILAFILQAYMIVLLLSHINNKFLFHIYMVEEFILDMLFYRALLKKTYPFKDVPEKRPIFLWAIALFVAFAIISALFITDINKFPMYLFIVQCIVMIICATWYDYNRSFYEVQPPSNYDTADYKLYKGPVFWINRGKLIYFSATLLIIIMYNMSLETGSKEMALITWRMQDVILIILHIFMGIGFLKFTGDPQKVMDWEGNYRKADNNIQRKQYKQKDLSYMEFLKKFPEYFEKLKKLNPDLIPASYTFEEYKKDFNEFKRSQYIAKNPEMIALLKESPSTLKNFKQENPDLFNEADKA